MLFTRVQFARTSLARLHVRRLNQRGVSAKLPQPIRRARSHRRAYSQLPVQPHEIVLYEVQRHRVSVILDLLGEGVREPGEPAHVHSNREVLTLHDRPCAYGRAVPALGSLESRAVGLP